MLNPREMAEFFGFTEKEVQELCSKYDRSFEETKAWYNGYELSVVEAQKPKVYAMYNPKSVVDAMLSGIFDNYWNQTETYEALKAYICMNFDGLKDAVVKMLAGDRMVIFEILRHRSDIISWEIRKDSANIFVEKPLRRRLFITRMTRGWI